jgi:hypothetical protein
MKNKTLKKQRGGDLGQILGASALGAFLLWGVSKSFSRKKRTGSKAGYGNESGAVYKFRTENLNSSELAKELNGQDIGTSKIFMIEQPVVPPSNKSAKANTNESVVPPSNKSAKANTNESVVPPSNKSAKANTNESVVPPSNKSAKANTNESVVPPKKRNRISTRLGNLSKNTKASVTSVPRGQPGSKGTKKQKLKQQQRRRYTQTRKGYGKDKPP